MGQMELTAQQSVNATTLSPDFWILRRRWTIPMNQITRKRKMAGRYISSSLRSNYPYSWFHTDDFIEDGPTVDTDYMHLAPSGALIDRVDWFAAFYWTHQADLSPSAFA
jgi:hypothetical protein